MQIDAQKILLGCVTAIAVGTTTALVKLPNTVAANTNDIEHIEKELDEAQRKQQQNREQLIRIEENTKYIKEALEKISK